MREGVTPPASKKYGPGSARAARGGVLSRPDERSPVKTPTRDPYLMPSFLRMSAGMEALLTMMDMVLKATKGFEKYQTPP